MNASIFHLVPSARSYRSFLPPFLFFFTEAVPIFSCHFYFQPRSFHSLSAPLANGTRLPFAFIQRFRRVQRSVDQPRPLPSAIVYVGDTREPILTFHFSRRGSTFALSPHPLPRYPVRHVAKLTLHQRSVKEGNFAFLLFSLRRLFPIRFAGSRSRVLDYYYYSPFLPVRFRSL